VVDDKNVIVEDDVEAPVKLVELFRNEIAYDDILYDDTPLVVQVGPNDG
jgi:hypothetical protein